MKEKFNVRSLVLLGLLTAVVALFSLTPIGSIPIGPLSITLNIIPIAIAAIALGPTGGLIMGMIVCTALVLIRGSKIKPMQL